MRRNIRESATRKIRESIKVIFGGWSDVVVQVRGYRVRLVIRLREVIAEASGASGPSDLRADGLSATD